MKIDPSVRQSVREACQRFIDHPTFKTLRDISLNCRLATNESLGVPCVLGNHQNNDPFEPCGECPLLGFVHRACPNYSIHSCPVCYGISVSHQKEVYKQFKGELVIAMVRFVLGWREEDDKLPT